MLSPEFLNWCLPLVFTGLMGLAVLIYVILDGYDLGIGILMHRADEEEKEFMVAAIGPFWDANETWLVLGVGLLLVAFPLAHGVILTALYMPTALMLGGLILRGVSFDFRTKAKVVHKDRWNKAFMVGSWLTTFTQGYMLGQYIMGFSDAWECVVFSVITGGCLVAGYALMGACWLILKTEGLLQMKAVRWARKALWGTTTGLVLVSCATPLISPRIFEKWFTLPHFFFLLPLPLMTGALILILHRMLKGMPYAGDRYAWGPFVCGMGLFTLGFLGLAYSFYPFIVPDQLTVWQAASDSSALLVILVGALLVLPFIIGYTIFAYRVFWGKVKKLTYY